MTAPETGSLWIGLCASRQGVLHGTQHWHTQKSCCGKLLAQPKWRWVLMMYYYSYTSLISLFDSTLFIDIQRSCLLWRQTWRGPMEFHHTESHASDSSPLSVWFFLFLSHVSNRNLSKIELSGCWVSEPLAKSSGPSTLKPIPGWPSRLFGQNIGKQAELKYGCFRNLENAILQIES